MSTVFRIPVDDSSATRIERSGGTFLRTLLREPLLHFLVLGGLLFAVDYLRAGNTEDPHLIVMDAAVDKESRDVFAATRGRQPDAAELEALRRVWLDNELLYREGLAMQLDKGDPVFKERVVFKALSVLEASNKVPAHDEALLRQWFEQHREKYDEPARYDFQEAALSEDHSEAAVRSFVAALNAGTPGDAKAGLRVFKGRPYSNVVQSYGEDFARELEKVSPGQWQALHARDAWRAIRLESITPAKRADFEANSAVVLQDWTDAVMAEQRTTAVRNLEKKYRVKVETAK